MTRFSNLTLAMALCFSAQEVNAQDKGKDKMIGPFVLSLAETPNIIHSRWNFTKEGRAIENGKDMGTWTVSGGKTIITYSNKQAGQAVLTFKDDDTLVGKNVWQNRKIVFNWVLKREKTEVAQKPKEEHAAEKAVEREKIAAAEKAKARIEMLGGRLELGKDGSNETISVFLNESKVTDADLAAHIKGLTNLKTLVLYRSSMVSDTGLLSLKQLTKLRELNLVGTNVTDNGVAQLSGLTDLERLAIDDTIITDAALANIKGFSKLKELGLYNTRITDAGLAHIKELRHLQILNLDSTGITDAGLAHLAELSELQTLKLAWAKITDAGLAHIKGLTNLKEVNLNETNITDAGAASLKSLTNLKVLGLKNTKVTAKGVAELRQALPSCKIMADEVGSDDTMKLVGVWELTKSDNYPKGEIILQKFTNDGKLTLDTRVFSAKGTYKLKDRKLITQLITNNGTTINRTGNIKKLTENELHIDNDNGTFEEYKKRPTPAEAPAPTEITADFLPHRPGTTHYYDTQMTLPNGKAAILRTKKTQKENGVIESTTVRIGSLKSDENLWAGHGFRVTWLKDLNQPLSPTYHRIKGDNIEIGSNIEGLEGIQWEPVLKIGAKVGDTWKWESKTGTVEYKVLQLTGGISSNNATAAYADKPAVVIQSTWAKPVSMVQLRIFVKGIGEAERSSFKSDKKEPFGFIHFVEEDRKQVQGNVKPNKQDNAKIDKTLPAKTAEILKADGQLTKNDPKDRIRTSSVHKVHTVKLLAGKTYTIDLVSRDCDSYLRLENSAGEQLAEDDDSGSFPDARIVFRAPKDDTYRIVATSFDGKTGNYTLTIREGRAANKGAGQKPVPGPGDRQGKKLNDPEMAKQLVGTWSRNWKINTKAGDSNAREIWSFDKDGTFIWEFGVELMNLRETHCFAGTWKVADGTIQTKVTQVILGGTELLKEGYLQKDGIIAMSEQTLTTQYLGDGGKPVDKEQTFQRETKKEEKKK